MEKRHKKITKGAGRGYLISICIHLILFLLAGLLIVFTVDKKEYKKFVPPEPIDRPKMQLKKPKVKVNQNVKPKQTQRIVTKVKPTSMPDISLPEISGMSDGFTGGVGGFELMPNLEEVTLFGGGHTIGNDFVGHFYDLKRDRSGRPIPTDANECIAELEKFIRGGWNTARLAKFYQSPKKLYTTAFMIPPVRSSVAPSAFGEKETGGWCWAAHYKGQLVHHEDIRFRFWGHGDDVLIVAVDGETVLNASWPDVDGEWGGIYGIGGTWNSSAKNNLRFYLGNNLSRGGDWIELKAGEPRDMEVLIGEVPGGVFCSMLTVEVEGEEYPRNKQGGPILPMFKTEEPSLDMIDEIYRALVPEEAAITNGPVFRDYNFSAQKIDKADDKEIVNNNFDTLRTWNLKSGKTYTAEFVSLVGDKVFLENDKGKQAKISLSDFSISDQEYISLSKPPSFSTTFVKSSSVRFVETTPYLEEDPPRINDFIFSAKIKKTDTKEYNHEVTVEFFAIAKELIGDKFILVDRQKSSFIPTKENDFSHTFSGPQIEFMEYVYDGDRRGKEYAGNLVVIYDKFGRVIDYQTSNQWLYDHMDNLKKIPIGRFFDKTCQRVIPTSPKAQRY